MARALARARSGLKGMERFAVAFCVGIGDIRLLVVMVEAAVGYAGRLRDGRALQEANRVRSINEKRMKKEKRKRSSKCWMSEARADVID